MGSTGAGEWVATPRGLSRVGAGSGRLTGGPGAGGVPTPPEAAAAFPSGGDTERARGPVKEGGDTRGA